MRRTIAVIISLCMIVTGAFGMLPYAGGVVSDTDMEASAASYPALKKISYKATGDQRKDMVGFAKSQIGYQEKGNNLTFFGAWYGMNRQPWCAMFICWCAAKSGVSKTTLPRLANADRAWAKKQKVYYKSRQWGGKYTPKPGDLIYFSWRVRDYADHIGMVSGTGKVNGVTYVYTIEGNKHDKVKTGSYAINNRYILGYASPKYATKGATKKTTTAAPKYTVTYNANGGQNPPANQTKVKGKTLKLSTAIPTRVGFSFLGWADNANATGVQYKAGADFNRDKATTLFAVWKDNTYQVRITKEGGLPKRAAPGTDKQKKGTLAKDSIVTIVETKDGWGKLADGCWIMLKYTVKIEKTTTKTTTKPTTGTTAKPSTGTTATKPLGVYQTTGDLYKRSGPGKTYKEKGVLKKGARITVVEIRDGWARMADGTWSSMKFLKKVSGTTTNKSTTNTTTGTTGKSTTKATTKKPAVNVNKEFTVKVDVDAGLYMRTGPGKTYKSKGILPDNKKVTIKSVKGGWGQMKSNNYWVKLKYTNIVSGYKVKVTIKKLNMRNGASKKYKSIGYMKPGIYNITKISGDGNWGKLKLNGKWIMLKYTTRI